MKDCLIPPNFKLCLLALGSLANARTTLRSDVEYVLLVSDPAYVSWRETDVNLNPDSDFASQNPVPPTEVPFTQMLCLCFEARVFALGETLNYDRYQNVAAGHLGVYIDPGGTPLKHPGNRGSPQSLVAAFLSNNDALSRFSFAVATPLWQNDDGKLFSEYQRLLSRAGSN